MKSQFCSFRWCIHSQPVGEGDCVREVKEQGEEQKHPKRLHNHHAIREWKGPAVHPFQRREMQQVPSKATSGAALCSQSSGAGGTCTCALSIPAEKWNERIVQHREDKHQEQTSPPQLSPSLPTDRFHEMLQSACHQDKQAFKLEPDPTGFTAVRIHYYPSVTDQDNTFHSGNILDQKVKALKLILSQSEKTLLQ